MIPYYALYLLLFFLNAITKNTYTNEEKRKTFFCVGAFVAIATMFSLRHQTMGIDLIGDVKKEVIGYLGAFERINLCTWSEIFSMESFLNYEKGFIIFNKLVGTIYNNKQFFLAVCAVVSTLPIMLYIRRKSDNPLMAVLIYLGLPVFLLSFSGLRQAIAIAITVTSVKYIGKEIHKIHVDYIAIVSFSFILVDIYFSISVIPLKTFKCKENVFCSSSAGGICY